MYNKINYPSSYIVWDLETTGFDGNKDHIVEIGMFKVDNGEVTEAKRWVLNHGIDISPEITAINGMTKEIIDSEGADPIAVLNEFVEYIRDSTANITHNGIKFDIPFLVNHIGKVLEWNEERMKGLSNHLNRTAIDTAMMFKGNMHGIERHWNENFHQYASRVGEQILRGKYNLGVCCDELGVDRSKVTQHRALGDVELTHEIYKKMIEI